MRKLAIVTYLKILSLHSPAETEEKHRKVSARTGGDRIEILTWYILNKSA
jgi:hypothetical protein